MGAATSQPVASTAAATGTSTATISAGASVSQRIRSATATASASDAFAHRMSALGAPQRLAAAIVHLARTDDEALAALLIDDDEATTATGSKACHCGSRAFFALACAPCYVDETTDAGAQSRQADLVDGSVPMANVRVDAQQQLTLAQLAALLDDVAALFTGVEPKQHHASASSSSSASSSASASSSGFTPLPPTAAVDALAIDALVRWQRDSAPRITAPLIELVRAALHVNAAQPPPALPSPPPPPPPSSLSSLASNCQSTMQCGGLASRLLSPLSFALLYASLPEPACARTWSPLFATYSHGASFLRLVSSVEGYVGPSLLVVKARACDGGAALRSSVFALYFHVPLRGATDFVGTTCCALIKIAPSFKVLHTGGVGHNYQYFNSNPASSFPRGIGAGGRRELFRVFLDADFRQGTCRGKCSTYESGFLVEPPADADELDDVRFTIECAELWALDSTLLADAAAFKQRQDGVTTSMRKVNRRMLAGESADIMESADVKILDWGGVNIGVSDGYRKADPREATNQVDCR